MKRGEDVLEIPRLSYQLLLALVEAAPRLLTIDELIEEVWAGRVVSPETVTQRVKLLRQVLGDDASEPRYIGLVRGEGYRLLPVVKAPSAAGSLPETATLTTRAGSNAKWLTVLVAVALVMASFLYYQGNRQETEPSVIATPAPANSAADQEAPAALAVLPFFNASENPEDLYISEGLGDELRDQLGRELGLRIAARTSSIAFRNQTLDATEIARRLGVDILVDGTVRREGNQLKISVQIIDGATGFQTWSRIYALQMQNLLSIQQEIAREVAQQLFPLADRSTVTSKPATRNVSANELMLLARYYEQQVREETIVDQAQLLQAIDLYRQATEADPESALAHSRLGAALLYSGDVQAAEAPIFQALKLDPDLSDAQYTLGLYYWKRRLPGSGPAYERAIQLNENNADALSAYAKWLWHQGNSRDPEQYLRQALALDPMSYSRYLDLGNFLGNSGRHDSALELAEEIKDRFDAARSFMILARIYELTGQLDIAIGWALRASERRPDIAEINWMVAELYARIGDFDQAAKYEPAPGIGQLFWQRKYQQLIDLGEDLLFERPGELQTIYTLAHAYNATGRFDQAARILTGAGLPETALIDTRRAADEAALVQLADAQFALGQADEANEFAQWTVEFMFKLNLTNGSDAWWPLIYSACAYSILDQPDRMMDSLEVAMKDAGLPWYPLVADMACFQRHRENQRYVEVVEDLGRRMQELRQKLPSTLASMGVTAQ